jgi:hypothetical protein
VSELALWVEAAIENSLSDEEGWIWRQQGGEEGKCVTLEHGLHMVSGRVVIDGVLYWSSKRIYSKSPLAGKAKHKRLTQRYLIPIDNLVIPLPSLKRERNDSCTIIV